MRFRFSIAVKVALFVNEICVKGVKNPRRNLLSCQRQKLRLTKYANSTLLSSVYRRQKLLSNSKLEN